MKVPPGPRGVSLCLGTVAAENVHLRPEPYQLLRLHLAVMGELDRVVSPSGVLVGRASALVRYKADRSVCPVWREK